MTPTLQILSGDFDEWPAFADTPTCQPFDPLAVELLDSLSRHLVRDAETRTEPELIALAFWLRRANLEQLAAGVVPGKGDLLLAPRGTVFHITPSNVPTIGFYSWSLSLLAGNRNIVRVSSRASGQTDRLLLALNTVLEEDRFAPFRASNLFVTYAAQSGVTETISGMTDVRVIWGGDESVRAIRAVPIPPASIELTFADRYSVAAIDASGWLAIDAMQRDEGVRRFLNDSLSFAQMACSSPRILYWIGDADTVERARHDFWTRATRIEASTPSQLTGADYVNKLVVADSLAIDFDVVTERSDDGALVRVWSDSAYLPMSAHCGGGLYFEHRIESLAALLPRLDAKVQTLSYAGIADEVVRAFLASLRGRGVDRAVPFGSALDFAAVWDGFDLLRSLTRTIHYVRDRLLSPQSPEEN